MWLQVRGSAESVEGDGKGEDERKDARASVGR